MKINYFYYPLKLKKPWLNNIFNLKKLGYNIALNTTFNIKNPDYGYFYALANIWGKETYIHLEQDIIATPSQIDELINCPEENCAFAVKLSPKSNYSGNPNYFQNKKYWNLFNNKTGQLYEQNERPTYATAMGFSKISLKTQLSIKLKPYPWNQVDANINPITFHCHYEAFHDHFYI